jgi:hypothetical protein
MGSAAGFGTRLWRAGRDGVSSNVFPCMRGGLTDPIAAAGAIPLQRGFAIRI